MIFKATIEVTREAGSEEEADAAFTAMFNDLKSQEIIGDWDYLEVDGEPGITEGDLDEDSDRK